MRCGSGHSNSAVRHTVVVTSHSVTHGDVCAIERFEQDAPQAAWRELMAPGRVARAQGGPRTEGQRGMYVTDEGCT